MTKSYRPTYYKRLSKAWQLRVHGKVAFGNIQRTGQLAWQLRVHGKVAFGNVHWMGPLLSVAVVRKRMRERRSVSLSLRLRRRRRRPRPFVRPVFESALLLSESRKTVSPTQVHSKAHGLAVFGSALQPSLMDHRQREPRKGARSTSVLACGLYSLLWFGDALLDSLACAVSSSSLRVVCAQTCSRPSR